MSETGDFVAHLKSIQPDRNSIKLLDGQRNNNFNFYANQTYKVPSKTWDNLYDGGNNLSPDAIEFIQWYVQDHYQNQIGRIVTLERYAEADNDIHYWNSEKSEKRADNRIASGLPKYITSLRVGYQFGNDLTFGYENQNSNNTDAENLLGLVTDFNKNNDEPYHEKNIAKNMFNTGRAYELLYIQKDTNIPKVTNLDPSTCFVVYDTDVEPSELFAVRYYAVNIKGETNYQIEVYTTHYIFYFTADGYPNADWQLDNTVEHYFNAVPINEFNTNETKTGIWESELDKIDAYDKSLSEMANSQEDFSNSTLVISGDVKNPQSKVMLKDNYGNQVYIKSNGDYTTDSVDENGYKLEEVTYNVDTDKTDSNLLVLKPSIIDNPSGGNTVVPTDAKYLTKSLDANEWNIYRNALLDDIHKDTNTPDISDQNFSNNASGVAMSYKLWGADQERTTSETLYKRSIMRRLRLLFTYWNIVPGSNVKFNNDDPTTNPANSITITFNPNLPKNNQETLQLVQGLVSTGQISNETAREMISNITGVSAEQENDRMQDQNNQNDARNVQMAKQLYQQNNNNEPNNKVDDNDND